MRFGWIAALAGGVVAAGCVDYKVGRDPPSYPESHPQLPGSTTVEDRIVQTVTPLVDTLFVIDNSCSMKDAQDSLTTNFFRFMDYFVGSGLDGHVGVVSTDLDSPQFQGRLQEARGYTFLDPETEDPSDVFGEMATLGTTGSPDEKGLGATYLGLEIYRDTFNAGFFREEAAIHTVVISDEEDQTEEVVISEDEFMDWYSGLKREARDRTFSSIVTTIGPEAGTRYLDVTKEIGGTLWNIDNANWDSVLDALGLQASGMKREFFLSRLPVEDTIEVWIELADGTTLNGFVAATGDPPIGDYVYDRSRNSVSFVDLVPDPLSAVVIRYVSLTGFQDANAQVKVAR